MLNMSARPPEPNKLNAHQLSLPIRVQPRARRNAVEVSEDGAVRVRVTAAPERGRANAVVVRLLAKQLGVSKSSVSITRGLHTRDKTIRVDGIGASEVTERLRGGG